MASEAKNGDIGEASNKAAATNINLYQQWLDRWPDPSTISAERMQAAEEIAWKEVLYKIHPTLDEDEKRADITLFLQTLITHSFLGVEVFPYGSVPLKTYLGDGDIDLTVICSPDIKDSLADDIYTLLKNEERNIYAECEVKETTMIGAEVKLVRCKVNNVSVDISFNQLGGLSALCFLEQIDRHVNKNHLFKLSILLIKAWCHYEGHILGAFHGLLATYALEVLILCIFQLFGSSLNGPLAVLYRFLDYYGKFDWSNYSISLDGPVRTSSLSHVVVTDLGNGGTELLLSREDRISYMDMFASSSYSSEHDRRRFAAEDLNIIDPLKENNNLGRRVNRANFTRMKAAFKYGARNLGRILLLPRESIPSEIKKFFECTVTKYGCSGAKLESLTPLSPSEEDVHLKSKEGDHIDDLMLYLEGARLARDVSDPVTATSLNEYMDIEAIENSDLLDLAGEYASLARNFVHGRCTIGFCATLPALRTPAPPTVSHQDIMWNRIWNMEANAAAEEQYIYTENSHVCRMGPYIPDVYSTSFMEGSFYPPLVNLMQEPSGQLQNGDGNAVVEGIRIEEKPINLNSEHDFPPLN